VSHYQWLENNLPQIFEAVGINKDLAIGSITSGGDKCYGSQELFEKCGLHFYHGVAIYLLLGFPPFCEEVRNTKNGWVDPFQWIILNKDKFTPILPEVNLLEVTHVQRNESRYN
jgi:hypothetical protein